MAYHLLDATEQSFQIPDQEARDGLQVNDTVKLIFRFPSNDTSCNFVHDGYSTERMWVRITEVRDKEYIGSLDNHPYAKNNILKHGSIIQFKPKNVIDIYRPSQDLDAMIMRVIGELGPDCTQEEVMARILAMNIRGVHPDCK